MKAHRSTPQISPAALVFVGLGLVACGRAPEATAPPPVDPIIATVDGQPIHRSAFLAALLESHGEAFLARYIEDRLLEARARELGVELSETQVKQKAEASIQTAIGRRFGGQMAALEAELADQGLTLERWRAARLKAVRRQLLAEAILRADPGEARLKQLFESRYGEDGVALEVAHILISTSVESSRLYARETYESEKSGLVAEARARAAHLRRRILSGADFAELARQASEDTSAAQGGWLGGRWAGRYGTSFDGLIRRIGVGEISPVVQSEHGFHVVRVEGVQRGARYQGAHLFIGAKDPPDGGAPSTAAPREGQPEPLARAMAVRARLLDGADFAAEAAAHSDDPVTRRTGGRLAAFQPGRFGPSVDAVLEQLPVGEISPPIKVEGGYQLFRLDARSFVPEEDTRLVRHLLIATRYRAIKARKLKGRLETLASDRARELLKDLAEGKRDFADLAREVSEDALTARSGGVIPRWRRAMLGPEVDRALAEMKPGQVRLIRGERGFHLLRLARRTVTRLEDVRPALMEALANAPVPEARITEWLRNQREAAAVSFKGWNGL